jgi:FtsP/CotA-like multicopper oxidase with cupredoxin domain
MTDTLVFEPGSRYDIVFDFAGMENKRIIMENIGGDAPFGGDYGGDLAPEDFFPDRQTDRIMAFDVSVPMDTSMIPNVGPAALAGIGGAGLLNGDVRVRKVALFEGKDEFGRLQPLLGTAEPATDYAGDPIYWPDTDVYRYAGFGDGPEDMLQMEGSIAWHSPTTENPALYSTEEWEIWNMTGDAHPVHLHLVNFEILGRQEIVFDSAVDEDGFIDGDDEPADNGVYLVSQPTVQHNSVAGEDDTYGIGFRIVHPSDGSDAYGDPIEIGPSDGYVENAPKDMVTALPGQITRIRATFDKPGRYVWHCHILSHEDHEMMRVLHVEPEG